MAGGHALTKVIYKPDSQSTEEYIAIVNPVEVSLNPHLLPYPTTQPRIPPQLKKWKEGGICSATTGYLSTAC